MKVSELVVKVAKRTGLSRAVVKSVLIIAFEEIAAELARAGRINFPRFGSFLGIMKDRCIRYNPRTGQPFQQEAKIVPKFVPSKFLTDDLKNGRENRI